MEIRLNKLICESGLCSRREADTMIEQGRVLVNDKTAEIGSKVNYSDRIKVDGVLLKRREETVYIALNKPPGITCTTDPTERDNVVDYVNFPSRIFNIGRLDKPSEGLLLLTNDGSIVNKILRESNDHDKEYVVTVDKPITPEFITRMTNGVPILGTITKKCKMVQETDTRFQITITQGLNRQIRRMCEALGYEVIKLKRTRIMNIRLDKLPSGEWRFLSDEELATLNKLLENSVETAAPAKKKQATSVRKADTPKEAAPEKLKTRTTFSAQEKEQKAKPANRTTKSGGTGSKERIGKSLPASAKANNSGPRASKGPAQSGGRAGRQGAGGGRPSGGNRSSSGGGNTRSNRPGGATRKSGSGRR